MSKKIQLSIPKPCHENWDAMTPVEKGKFCGSCQKQVVDFSNMNDRQVAEFFKKPSTGSVCGRFMTDQLDRSIEVPKKRIPWVKYFFQFTLPAFLISMKASAQKTQGKIKVSNVAKDTIARPVTRPITLKGDIDVVRDTIEPPICKVTMGIIAMPDRPIINEKITIHGRVLDENGNPLPGVSVMIRGTKTGAVTNANGLFSISPEGNPGIIAVVASSVGYITFEQAILKKNFTDNITIRLEPLQSMMVGELVVCRKPPVKKEIKKVPLIPDITDDKHTTAFRVFPNPVEPGANLNIEWKQAEEGYFSLELLNQSGQSVHKQDIWIDHEARILNVDIPLFAAGSYLLSITNKNSGKTYTEKIIVQ